MSFVNVSIEANTVARRWQHVRSTSLRGDEGGDHPVEVVEEAEQVEGELHPALALAAVQHVPGHDVCGVVEAGARHHGARAVAVDMVGDEGRVQQQGEPLAAQQEQHVEQDVQRILWQHQRIETVALINGVFVVCLQFIKGYNMENSEENEHGINAQCTDVRKRHKCESHTY